MKSGEWTNVALTVLHLLIHQNPLMLLLQSIALSEIQRGKKDKRVCIIQKAYAVPELPSETECDNGLLVRL